MYDYIIRIIEGAMDSNQSKVVNYSRKLAKHFEDEGKSNVAQKIMSAVEGKNTRIAKLDSLSTKPLDENTKMDIVDVIVPVESNQKLFFEENVEEEITSFLKSYFMRNDFIEHGLAFNNNLLLFGQPGTGKTELAKYISLQTGLPLLIVSLDGMVSSRLGDTAKNIRRVFDFAALRPCILFLDEFDVIAKSRDDKNDLGELKRVVNSLLQNIDGFDNSSILVAATNHEKSLDQAVWRRFSKKINLVAPNEKVRKRIIEYHLEKFPNNIMEDNKKLLGLIQIMEDLSPADIEIVFNNAFKKSIINKKNQQDYKDILYELYIHRNNGRIEEYDIIPFLYSYDVTQKDISILLGLSLRQVRKHLNI